MLTLLKLPLARIDRNFPQVSSLAEDLLDRSDAAPEAIAAELPSFALANGRSGSPTASSRCSSICRRCSRRPRSTPSCCSPENTVRTHLKAIYRALKAHRRTEAVDRARQLRLLDS